MVKKPEKGFLFHEKEQSFDDLKNYVSLIDKDEWNLWDYRQKKTITHSQTKSIKVKWIPLNVKHFDRQKIEYNEPYYTDIYSLLKPTFEKLEKFYDGEVYKILLVKMNKQSRIPPHIDSGFSLEEVHRIHIPIITNEKVYFGCDGRSINMKYGEIVEINNLKTHWVINNSDQERIHLIVDIIENSN